VGVSFFNLRFGFHYTQPAITQTIKNLERALGVPLVLRGFRGQRGVSLTPAGSAAKLFPKT
jgi:DNA-binding transcriptional LysR family regulator